MPLDKYTGNYSNEIYGQISVTAKENSLVATAGPIGMQIILTPWNRDTFIAPPQDLGASLGFASFYIGPDDRADSMILDVFNDATFERV